MADDRNPRSDDPKRHHYLPAGAHLRFFSIESQPDRIFLYEHGGTGPRSVGLQQAGVEKFLYSLEIESGELSSQLETELLSEIDGRAVSLMEKLNASRQRINLSAEETELLREFVSLQMLRTPAFRDMLRNFNRALLDRPEVLDKDARAALKAAGITLSEEEIKQTVAKAREHVAKLTAGRNYWLHRVGRFLELSLEELRHRSAEVWRSDGEYVITSDHPVARDYAVGLQRSNLLFPIGRHRVLYFGPRNDRPADGPLRLAIRRISSARAREVNKVTIQHAERFLLASVKIFNAG